MDERLKGLKVTDITKRFVRYNATQEEIEGAVYEHPRQRECVSDIDIEIDRSWDVQIFLRHCLEEMDTLSKNYGDMVEFDWEEWGICARIYEYRKVKEDLTGIDALQVLWKDLVREANNKRRDMDEYFRLKEKLGL